MPFEVNYLSHIFKRILTVCTILMNLYERVQYYLHTILLLCLTKYEYILYIFLYINKLLVHKHCCYGSVYIEHALLVKIIQLEAILFACANKHIFMKSS